MERKNFAQVLKDAKIDLKREYDRIYQIFYGAEGYQYSVRSLCEQFFDALPFRGTCISLDDFDETHNIRFERNPMDFDENYLIIFCEYVYNLACHIPTILTNDKILIQIYRVIDLIGYTKAEDDATGVTIFVPKSQPAIVVSETLPPKLSYKVIEYNHHSMKGDLTRKQATLKLLADQLESREKELMGINKNFKSDLSYLINNLNIRHNNIDPTSKSYKEAVAKMSKEELEKWYDKVYELCLYAFMMLDNIDYSSKTKELKTLLGEV